jgi:alpha-tubulin suppressor-like RCC1 family protein
MAASLSHARAAAASGACWPAAVATGNDHACALRLDGTVQCWGSNVRGELGRITPETRDDTPASVAWQAPRGPQH